MPRPPRFTIRPTWKPGEVHEQPGRVDLTIELEGKTVGRIYNQAGALGDKWSWTIPGSSGGLCDDLPSAKRAVYQGWRERQ